MKVRDSDVLALSSRDDREMKKYSTCNVQYHVVSRDDRKIKIMLFHQCTA